MKRSKTIVNGSNPSTLEATVNAVATTIRMNAAIQEMGSSLLSDCKVAPKTLMVCLRIFFRYLSGLSLIIRY